MFYVTSSSPKSLLSSILFALFIATSTLLISNTTPLFAQESTPDTDQYITPPIPFKAPQLGQPVPSTLPTTSNSQSPSVAGAAAETDRTQAASTQVANTTAAVAESTTTAVAVQPQVNRASQAPISVGLASTNSYAASARPAESASTIVERITAASPASRVNKLGVARMGETWEFPNVGVNERWLRIDLSEQMVFAYEGQRSVATFLSSTGMARTPTVTGLFRVRMKVSEQTMSGGEGAYAYNLPGVQWVMYFHSGYGLHGTYWHNNFGTPMSHGCVNLSNDNAKWLFDWAGPAWDGKTTWFPSTESNPGSLVLVHQ